MPCGACFRSISTLLVILVSGLIFESTDAKAAFFNAGFWGNRTYSLKYSTAAQNPYNGNCSSVVTVKTYNPGGSVANVSSNLTVNLSGAGTTTFYSDADCSNVITSVTILSGSNSGNFYFIDTAVASITITASATNYKSALQNETIASNPYLWTGGGGNSNWSTGANWSGGAAPGASNIAVFMGSACSTNCSSTIDANINVSGIRTLSNYSGTITQSAGVTITTGSWVQANGSFVGGNSTITDTGDLVVAGGTFTFPTTTLLVKANYIVSNSPTITTTGSTLNLGCTYGQTCTITPGSVTYNDVTFQGRYTTFTLGGATMNVGGNFSEGDTYGPSETSQKINSGTINVTGNISVINNGYQGSASVVAVGNASGQTISGSAGIYLPNLKIAAGSNSVTLSGTIQSYGGYTVASVGTLTLTGTTLLITCDYNTTCSVAPGSFTYNNVTLNSYYGNFDLGGNTFKVGGKFSAGDTYGPAYTSQHINNGTIMAYGDVAIINYGYMGSASVVVAGNASGQTITGNGAGYYIPNLNISAGTNPVTLSGTISVINSFTMTSVGTLTTSGSTLYLGCNYGTTCAITPGTVTYGNVALHGNYATLTLGGGTMNVGGNLEIGDTYGLSELGQPVNSGTINVYGNISVTNAGNKGTAWIVAKGNASGQLVSSTSPSIYLPNFTSDTGSNSISLSSGLNVAGSMSVASGTFGMAGYSLAVTSNLSVSSGATLTKSGGTLTYGSLSNSGTINP